MPTITSFDYNNKVRDLTDALSTIIAKQSNFLSNFPRVADARQRKHEWLELQLRPRSFTTTAITTAGVCTVTATEAAKCYVGQLVSLVTDPAVFRVTAVTTTQVTLAFVGSNGSSIAALNGLPTTGGTFRIQSAPMPSGSSSGEETFRQSGTDYNMTQIFRKNFTLSRTSMAINVYGNENALAYQEGHALFEIARDINSAAILGPRVDATENVNGAMGGLCFFGSQAGGLGVTVSNKILDDFIVNDAAQAIIDAGGVPDMVIVGPGQARVLSAAYSKQLFYTRPEETRGTYVGSIATQSSGNLMSIFQEHDILDTEAWVVDSSGFGLSYLADGGVESTPAGSADVDGISRKVIGELTLEFKNAKQRICKIKGLTPSATALGALKAA